MCRVFADGLVASSRKIVNLPERLDYILEKYSGGDTRREQGIRNNFSRCSKLENCLFSFLDFHPEQLDKQTKQYEPMFPA